MRQRLIWGFISLILIVVIVFGCSIVNSKINNLRSLNNDLTKENKQLKEQVEETDEPVVKEEDCSFIRTFRIVKIMNDYQTHDPNYTFVIIDQFQEATPFIISLDSNRVSSLKMDKSYEFKFKGKKTEATDIYSLNEIFKNFEIESIVLTDKVGLEQRQESCN